VATIQQERDAALLAYRAASAEYEAAQVEWDPYLAATGDIDTDSTAAEAAFDRLRTAHQAKQDALDSLWLAWRNRPASASDVAI
jgi:hypothetical protein